MDVTVEDARDRLEQLLDLAESGVEVVVTRAGKPPVRLLRRGSLPSSRPKLEGEALRRAIDEITRRAVAEALPGPDAAHSQDFL